MLRHTLAVSALMAGLALTPADIHAQTGARGAVGGGGFAVVPYGGYLISESFIEGPLDTSLGAVSAPLFGVQASVPLAAAVSLIGSVGYASGNLEVGVPLLGGFSFGASNALLMDAGVELSAPRGALRPILQLGAGAIRREVSVAGLSTTTTDMHVTGGIGADVPLAAGVALRLMAKDHYGKADFGSIGDFSASTRELHNVVLSGGLHISF